MNFPQ